MRDAITVFILMAAAAIAGCSNNYAAYAYPKIELSATSFDFGDINPTEGKRVETFFVRNSGNAPLTIFSLSTSCGCTEAEIDALEIPPGEQAKLTVTYDPSVHRGIGGKIRRIVYIKSNDPFHEEVELELTGNVLEGR
jgi:hypothetical protein